MIKCELRSHRPYDLAAKRFYLKSPTGEIRCIYVDDVLMDGYFTYVPNFFSIYDVFFKILYRNKLRTKFDVNCLEVGWIVVNVTYEEMEWFNRWQQNYLKENPTKSLPF